MVMQKTSKLIWHTKKEEQYCPKLKVNPELIRRFHLWIQSDFLSCILSCVCGLACIFHSKHQYIGFPKPQDSG